MLDLMTGLLEREAGTLVLKLSLRAGLGVTANIVLSLQFH
jgi:hypothetical protein